MTREARFFTLLALFAILLLAAVEIARALKNSGPHSGSAAPRARTGFDVGGDSLLTVLAVPFRHDQRAKRTCQRQRQHRSGCGLSDADAREARVTRQRQNTSKAPGFLQPGAEILQVVEALPPAPSLSGLKADYARERGIESKLADRGSNPRESTGLCTEPGLASPTIRMNPGAGATAARALQCVRQSVDDSSERRAPLRGRAARSARLVHTQKVAGSNPALATASKQLALTKNSARQHESAGRPASASSRLVESVATTQPAHQKG